LKRHMLHENITFYWSVVIM